MLALLCTSALADPAYTVFVPEARGLPGMFHDRDIRKAFPALAATDTKWSVCTNRMMSGAASITYLGRPMDREVTLKRSACQAVAHGLMCGKLEQSRAFYFESPRQNFVTADDVSYDEAIRVLAAYKANGIANAPDYLQTGWNYRLVRLVARTQRGYRLVMGEFLCAGCSARVDVILGDHGKLVLERVVDATCI